MSSLKHVVARRVHLERSTPYGKSLEREKDFKARIEQQHGRDRLLQILTEKARDSNPEEFKFRMLNSKMVAGKFVQFDKTNEKEKDLRKKRIQDQRERAAEKTRKQQGEEEYDKALEEGHKLRKMHIVFASDSESSDSEEQSTAGVPGNTTSSLSLDPDQD